MIIIYVLIKYNVGTLNKNILVNDTEYNLQMEFLLSVEKLK